MFKIVKESDIKKIYEAILSLNNIERERANKKEDMRLEVDKEVVQLQHELEKLKLEMKKELTWRDKLILEQEDRIKYQQKLITNQEENTKKVHEYLERVAVILKNTQNEYLKNLKEKSLSKIDYMAEGWKYPLKKEVRERLK